MTYRSPPIGPTPAGLQVPRPTPGTPLPGSVLPPPPPGRDIRSLAIRVALVALGVLAVIAVGVIARHIGPDALRGAVALALVPLVGVLLAVRWVDRWEHEPWQALAVALGWGASVAVLIALWLNNSAALVLASLGPTDVATVLGVAVVAPVVEESVKAAGVLLVFLLWRRSFDGPVDGLVYAATVAAGFAFVENILYFGTVIAQTSGLAGGGSAVAGVFFMRAVMSPFAHVLFTACTGLALGLASRSSSRYAWVWAFPTGLVVAIVLHGIWNGSALMGDGSAFTGLYVAFQVPLFLGTVGLVLWLRHQESRMVRAHLLTYATAGWFAPGEVAMLTSLGGRRRAAAWAERVAGRDARGAMRSFQAAATRLAYQRHRTQRGPADPLARAEEGRLLAELSACRQALHRSLPG